MSTSKTNGYGTSSFNTSNAVRLNYPLKFQPYRAGDRYYAPRTGGNVFVQNYNFNPTYRGWGANSWAGYNLWDRYCPNTGPSKFEEILMYGSAGMAGISSVIGSIAGLFKKGGSES